MTTATNVINAFLDNFNYVYKSGDNEGKRTGFKPWFFNKALTSGLESEATALSSELSQLAVSDKAEDEKLDAFFNAVNQHVTNAWAKRDTLSPATHHTDAINYDMHATLPPSMLREYDYQKPYSAGKFEKEIVNGLKAAEKLLDGVRLIQCQAVLKSVQEYNPVAKIWYERVTRI